ncbi:2-dehydropantoate 2-reductase [Treponema sp.]
MKEIDRVLIVGAGAVGAAVASAIHTRLPGSVSVLADGERLERYRQNGFIVNGKRYDFPLASIDKVEKFDLVIISVKHHHQDAAIELMQPFVSQETSIISLLNGISSEEILGAAFGPGPGAPENTKLPPYAMVLGIDAVRVGNDTRFESPGKIFFGETKNDPENLSPRVARIARFFDKAGVAYVVSENMYRSLWYKFMINVGINQASAILRAPYSIFQTQPDALSLMQTLMREVIAVSQAIGVNLDESDLHNWETTLAALHGDNLTSMCQDVLAKRKTEVELFAGTIRELGKKHAVPTPANEFCFHLLRAMELNYSLLD